MQKELDDAFGSVPEAIEPVVETVPTVEEAPADPGPLVEEVPPQPVTPPSEHQQQVPPGFVPVAEAQRLRARAREAEAAAAAAAAQYQMQPLDPLADVDQFNAALDERVTLAALNAKLDMSEVVARDRHGDAAVDEALQWALQRYRANPAYRDQILAQKDPYGAVIRDYRREQALERLGNADLSEIEQFRAWKAAQATLQAQPQPAAAPSAPSPSALPPRSLASATNAGGGTAPKADPVEERLNRMF